ncbi:MAG: type II toxin-antitoxin system VapC family toxin [Nitriliruptor sp.]|uniref:type II toxin-antitoxin system VapC family toxin n=1 Tax=Nitriliruptor sp. TaxID=2448056 RepID=UPI00349FD60E
MTTYVDTSAAAKLLVEEPESSAVAGWLDEQVWSGGIIASNLLLETELRRFAVREQLSQVAVTEILDRLELVEPDRALFHEAGILPGGTLRSLDALHLATVLRLDAESLLTYDVRLTAAAESLGVRVVAPGS